MSGRERRPAKQKKTELLFRLREKLCFLRETLYSSVRERNVYPI